MGDSRLRRPPPVRERPGEAVLRLQRLVRAGELGAAAQRLLQDALGGSSAGAAAVGVTSETTRRTDQQDTLL